MPNIQYGGMGQAGRSPRAVWNSWTTRSGSEFQPGEPGHILIDALRKVSSLSDLDGYNYTPLSYTWEEHATDGDRQKEDDGVNSTRGLFLEDANVHIDLEEWQNCALGLRRLR